ncbi:MAG TPA: 6-bladed beta-propeller [Gracilimonas sp.]|uniref:6-bladed beta-propeller n=1 Tax=Gracilimonas sp. TaxID=1974203 RepID=UPI002D97E809|nr:6-bladed beta-propeller [Gracilimonas sp.]
MMSVWLIGGLIETIRDVLKADTFYKTMIKYSFLLIALFLAACSSKEKYQVPEEFQHLKNLSVYSADTQPGKTISFKKEAVFGDTEDVLFANMEDIVVDSLGRVFIADRLEKVIQVFEPNGRYLTHIGREGRGPGEFDNIRKLQIIGDNLYVFDPAQFRVNIFSLGSFSSKETIMLARNRSKYPELGAAFPWIHELHVRDNGSFLAEFISNKSEAAKEWGTNETEVAIYLLDRSGNIVGEKLIDFKEDTRVNYKGLSVPVSSFYGSTLTILEGAGRFFIAEPENFLIKVYNMDGTYSYSFYYPKAKISLNQESAQRYDSTGLFIRNMKNIDELPETWPVLTDMKIDNQNRLWIATTIEDMKVYEWWVLEETGELITKFEWPRDQPIQEIKNGYLYSKKTDEETGAKFVVKYRIELTEK